MTVAKPERTPPESPVISPCIGICRMSADGSLCVGCMRTLDEIAAWSGAGEEFKRAVWQVLPERRLRHGPPPDPL